MAFAAAAQLPPPMHGQWARFERSGALSHIREIVEIATGPGTTRSQFRYLLRLTRTTVKSTQILWADSDSCADVREVIAGMARLRMPKPSPFGIASKDEVELIVDGTGYQLDAPSSDSNGRLTISSNVGSPLAAWVDESMTRLDRCWRTSE